MSFADLEIFLKIALSQLTFYASNFTLTNAHYLSFMKRYIKKNRKERKREIENTDIEIKRCVKNRFTFDFFFSYSFIASVTR